MLRVFVGTNRYSKWLFLANLRRVCQEWWLAVLKRWHSWARRVNQATGLERGNCSQHNTIIMIEISSKGGLLQNNKQDQDWCMVHRCPKSVWSQDMFSKIGSSICNSARTKWILVELHKVAVEWIFMGGFFNLWLGSNVWDMLPTKCLTESRCSRMKNLLEMLRFGSCRGFAGLADVLSTRSPNWREDQGPKWSSRSFWYRRWWSRVPLFLKHRGSWVSIQRSRYKYIYIYK